MPETAVHVVFHSHWDREWYLPFAVYRHRLLALVDSLLLALNREPALRFHLDGQMAIIDDYLELRPERLGALRRAAAADRVSLGPWYTLPDEHLVSGEALLRNLEMGLDRAARLGRPMPVGYLPDQFGHTAQMPQVLRLLGIDNAILWRGVPPSVTSEVFTWEALDGSAVTAVHLPASYAEVPDLPTAAHALNSMLRTAVAAHRSRNPDGPWLLMSGDDHATVPVGAATALGGSSSDLPATVSSLAEYVAAAPPPSCTCRGELHSASGSNVLKGTLSARFPLKLRHAGLERRLERYLEPVLALSREPWPAAALDYCWRQLILNSAHDSICGCSIDLVHEQANERLDHVASLVGHLWAGAGRAPGGMFNPSLFERQGVPPLGIGPADRAVAEPATPLDLELEDCPDEGDEYTFDPPAGATPTRRPLTGAGFQRKGGEPFTRVSIAVENRTPDHRLRLVVPADTREGAWAGVPFGAVHRPYRPPGTEPGIEYDVPVCPGRLWVDAGGVAVFVAGPFEYELLRDGIAITLLRCVGWLSRDVLRHRPVAAGPCISTPAAQMLGRHEFEIGVLHHDGSWAEALVPRWAEVFAHPLVPAPELDLAPGPADPDPAVILSALRRRRGRRQIRTYRCGEPWRIEERWLDPA